MSEAPQPIFQLLREDPRYTLEGYEFVRDALAYAQEMLEMGQPQPAEMPLEGEEEEGRSEVEHHLTGQQLCEAIRQYALEQYGYMAKVVLNNWGLKTTSDFGEIVYNLIRIGLMKKSLHDRREDFDDVYDFEKAFQENYRITPLD